MLVGLPLPWLVYGIWQGSIGKDASVVVEAGTITLSVPILPLTLTLPPALALALALNLALTLARMTLTLTEILSGSKMEWICGVQSARTVE